MNETIGSAFKTPRPCGACGRAFLPPKRPDRRIAQFCSKSCETHSDPFMQTGTVSGRVAVSKTARLPESAARGLPERLKRLREAHGWPVQALAARVGVAVAVISNAETGRNDPMARTLAALARVFGCSMDELWYGDDASSDAPVEPPPVIAQDEVATTFAQRVRSFRLTRGWSQRELGEQIGVSPQAIVQLESGRHTPNLTTFVNLARVFDVGLDVLWTGHRSYLGVPSAEDFERRAFAAEETLVAIQQALTRHKSRANRRLRSRPQLVAVKAIS